MKLPKRRHEKVQYGDYPLQGDCQLTTISFHPLISLVNSIVCHMVHHNSYTLVMFPLPCDLTVFPLMV